MADDNWYETTGQKHLRGFIEELLKEKRSGTVNVDRIMNDIANSNKRLRQSGTNTYQERRKRNPIGAPVICTVLHPDGNFTIGKSYKISSYQVVGKGAGIRIRDDKRQRRDFNFIPTSKNFIWDYFRLE